MGRSKNISIVICICDNKEPHIKNIQKMKVSNQQIIMAYINQVTQTTDLVCSYTWTLSKDITKECVRPTELCVHSPNK